MNPDQLFFAIAGVIVTSTIAIIAILHKYIDARLDAINPKFDLVSLRFDIVNAKIDTLAKEINQKFEQQELLLKLHEALHHRETD